MKTQNEGGVQLLKNLVIEKDEEIESLKRASAAPQSNVAPKNFNCYRCKPDLLDLSDDLIVFCKKCIRDQLLEEQDFILFMQCTDCEEAVSVDFKCSCVQGLKRRLDHLNNFAYGRHLPPAANVSNKPLTTKPSSNKN
jgi:hypothetical protein